MLPVGSCQSQNLVYPFRNKTYWKIYIFVFPGSGRNPKFIKMEEKNVKHIFFYTYRYQEYTCAIFRNWVYSLGTSRYNS